MLLASRRKDIVGDYHHPTWLLVFGVIIVVIAGYSGILSLRNMAQLIPR
jgi:Mn2+/Fe2+ NRAMP family transporter